jgi:hypothetical protein
MIDIIPYENDFFPGTNVYFLPAVFAMQVTDDKVFHSSKIKELGI